MRTVALICKSKVSAESCVSWQLIGAFKFTFTSHLADALIQSDLQIFGMTYYHIWPYKFIREGRADDLISRWLLPTVRLV
jgi:hypothetical protein